MIEILIVLFLIILNGLFAMSEIAIVSARKSKLQQQANEGNKNAQAALELAKSPNRFLSTIQIGITLVGIFAGAFGGATIADGLADRLQEFTLIAPYSDMIALVLVVSVITYLSLIIGELVPKRLGLSNPEKIAAFVARPMNKLSVISNPLVSLLSVSTEWILRILPVKEPSGPTVSDEEVRVLLREGTRSGVFETAEKDIVERTLRLSDRKVNTLMTSRKEITWLDIDSSPSKLRKYITESTHSYFPVCRDSLDKVIGIVRTEDILTSYLVEEKIDLKKYLHKPLFIPEGMKGLRVLELFKKSGIHTAIVVDEYGSVQGLLSLKDILEAIVGDIPSLHELEDLEIKKRDEGSWLIDGLLSIDEFKEHFHIKMLPEEKSGIYHTVGGFMMHRLGHIPSPGEKFIDGEHCYEVVDMDGNRVDKIMVSLVKKT